MGITFKRLMVMGAVTLLLVGCGKDDSDDFLTPEELAAEEEQRAEREKQQKEELEKADKEAKEKEESVQELTIGDMGQLDGLEITLDNVRYESGGEFDEAENDEYIVLKLTVTNSSEEEKIISSEVSIDFKDSDKYSYKQEVVLEGVEEHLDARLGVGESITGEIAYDANRTEGYTVSYSEPFNVDGLVWKFPQTAIKEAETSE